MSYWYTEHKKARHPVGLFYIFDALVWLLSNPACPLLSFLIVVWSILLSMCPW